MFALLSRRGQIDVKVFYTWGKDSVAKFDPDFGKVIEWDIPLLEGYAYEFLENTAAQPGSHHFSGIVNPAIIRAVESFRPDAVLVFGWNYRSHLKVLRHFRGRVPVYFRGDSTLLNEQPGWKKLARRLLLRWIYRHVSRALYVGTANKAYYRAAGLQESRLHFAPHAIDNLRFENGDEATARQLRAGLGLAEGELLLLYAGKFEPRKDPLFLLRGFLALDRPGVHLLLLGNGPLEAELKEEAKGHPAVHFMDFQNQSKLPAIYKACDLFCLSSQSETWGLAVNEAMAAGKPVLVTDRVGCATDLVQPGVNGAVVPSGNVAALRDALQQLCASPETLRRMGRASQQLIGEWSYEKQAAAIETALQQEPS